MYIKVCGVKETQTARELVEAGVDAIGLNFYPASIRYVSTEIASQIVNSLPGHVDLIGLFVNETVDEILKVCQTTGLKIVQLHGDENLYDYQRLTQEGLEVILAWRMPQDDLSLKGLSSRLAEAESAGLNIKAVIIDALSTSGYGGTGECVCWADVWEHYQRSVWPPLILAGGLTPATVAEAIGLVQPWGVDVASGVESIKGVKDLEKCREFIRKARESKS